MSEISLSLETSFAYMLHTELVIYLDISQVMLIKMFNSVYLILPLPPLGLSLKQDAPIMKHFDFLPLELMLPRR